MSERDSRSRLAWLVRGGEDNPAHAYLCRTEAEVDAAITELLGEDAPEYCTRWRNPDEWAASELKWREWEIGYVAITSFPASELTRSEIAEPHPAIKLAVALGDTPELTMRRTLDQIANMSPLWTASAQEIARNGLRAADAIQQASARSMVTAPVPSGIAMRVHEPCALHKDWPLVLKASYAPPLEKVCMMCEDMRSDGRPR